MSAAPKFAHVVFQTAPPESLRTWYCTIDGYAADSVGPSFDPEELPAGRRAGATVEELSDARAARSNFPDPMPLLLGAEH